MTETTPAPALRPMTVADLVDEIFRLYRRHFGLLVGISALLWLPAIILITVGLALLGVFDTEATGPLVVTSGAIQALVIGLLVFLLALPIMLGAMAAAVSDLYLGRPTTIGACIARGFRAAPRIIGAYFLIVLAVTTTFTAVVVIFAILLATVVPRGAIAVQALVFLALLVLVTVPTVWIAVTTTFVGQAIVLEGAGIFRSISRSATLASGSRWRIIGINLLLSLIGAVLFSVPSSFVAVLLLPVLGPSGLIVGQLFGILAQVLYNPIQFGTLTLLYYDLRVRKEAFDLTLAAERLAAS